MASIKKPFYYSLYFQVIIAMVIGTIVGLNYPALGVEMKPLGDGFIKLIKMIIGPIIFTSVVVGIAKIGDMKKLGRVGIKSLIYFEIVSTVALIFGLFMSNLLKPGEGLNLDINSLDGEEFLVTEVAEQSTNVINYIVKSIPNTIIQPFAEGNILQILFLAILMGIALINCGKKGRDLVSILDQSALSFFGIINIIMKIAPIGAFGALAYAAGKYGLTSLLKLSTLVGCVFLSSTLFIFIFLGSISKFLNINIWHFIKYIKNEIFLSLSTGSSESALPNLMNKLEKLGCKKSIVGLVIPTGYSFNLDGTSIYLTMAIIFIAQAFNIELTLSEQLFIVGFLFFTSKGAAAVAGGGFIILVSTLSGLSVMPVACASILLGVDRIMGDIRSITNIIGNGIATIAIAKWENAFDEEQAFKALYGNKPKTNTDIRTTGDGNSSLEVV